MSTDRLGDSWKSIMGYRNLQSCVRDLEKNGHLVRIPVEVDACLEAAEIHRRVHDAGGRRSCLNEFATVDFRW